jgi:hypothetical protein
MAPLVIRAVAFEKDGMWIAHCLEYSLVSYAESLKELPNELLRQLIVQVEADLKAGRAPLDGFKRAPKRYWDMFDAAQAASTPPVKPRKSLALRWREFVDRSRIDAQLFPVAAT